MSPTQPVPPPSAHRPGPGAAAALVAAAAAAPALLGAVLLLDPAPAVRLALTAAALVAAATALLALLLVDRARRAADELAARLLHELAVARDQSLTDPGTGLFNRRGLLLVGAQVVEHARRSGGAVHACVVDVTPAVPVGGQAVLAAPEDWAAVASALRGATRTSDVVAREDEGRFLVLGPGAGLHAQELERRVRVGLAQGRLQAGARAGADPAVRSAVEVGAAVLAPWDEGGAADLLTRAEQSLAQRRALRRSAPAQHGWGRRRGDGRSRTRSEGGGTGGGGASGGTGRTGT